MDIAAICVTAMWCNKHPCILSGSWLAFLGAGLASVTALCAGGKRRGIHHRGRTITHVSRQGAEVSHLQCGAKITARVDGVFDAGLFLYTEDGTKVFIPRLNLQKSIREYVVGENLEVTVKRPPVPGTDKDVVATDRCLKSMSSVQVGSIVEGKVVKISDAGVLLDIDVPKHAFARWPLLKPLGQERPDLKVGDTIKGLKVRMIHPSSVVVGAPSLELRQVNDFTKGEKVKGIVENISHGGVFFDVGAPKHAAAFERKGQLSKIASSYMHGEEVLLEVVKVAAGKIDVKDLGYQG